MDSAGNLTALIPSASTLRLALASRPKVNPHEQECTRSLSFFLTMAPQPLHL
jgi:hypothetical protein